MGKQTLFKPRDFIYMNTSKLDSYFSQLFGGLIQNIQTGSHDESKTEKRATLTAEAAAEFGLGTGSTKLLEFLLSQVGNIDISGKAGFNIDWYNVNMDSNVSHTHKTLEHFQYTLFEESMSDLGYLIDLNNFYSRNREVDAGKIREELNNSDFVKYTASEVSISDYRNASEFVKLIKKVIDLSIEYNMGELIDDVGKGADSASIKREATAKIARIFIKDQSTIGLSEKFNAIVDAIYEFFNGNMIPHDILLTSIIQLGKNGNLTFESQIQDQFLLENRTELSYKYGFFEDTEWTIIGQITSINNSVSPNFNEVLERTQDRITQVFSQHDTLNINSTVKEIVKEIDQLSKEIGLLPLVGKRNIAITPVAIYREPKKNGFFVD